MSAGRIDPTIGRVVWYFCGQSEDPSMGVGPRPAIVADVNGNGTLNLAVVMPNGSIGGRRSVKFSHPDSGVPAVGPYAMWPTLQVAAPDKTAALLMTLADRVAELESFRAELTGESEAKASAKAERAEARAEAKADEEAEERAEDRAASKAAAKPSHHKAKHA